MKSKNDFSSKLNLILRSIGPERFKLSEPLEAHTFSKSQGIAEGFYVATSVNELTKIMDLAFELKIPYFILGAGTKSLISDSGMRGLVVKNRTSQIKILAFKGKVGREGIGLSEATLEVNSGVSLQKLNDYLVQQKLEAINGISSKISTVGGSIFLDPAIREKTEKVRVWEQGEVIDIEIYELKKVQHVVLSVLLKLKAQG